eukprot:TRINITY_DN511_c0_g1_i1.p1 TRINITY_DN511_c0_g1~~TRINITY_DN511_c0_g1_i1.p1  ORF type:complete len:154 (+),score=12.60 TRINITY_DN511_c0_g1_i1:107-568(+)
MPRSRSSGRPAARPSSRPAAKQYHSAAAHPPAPVRHAPPPAVLPSSAGGSMFSGLAGTIVQGVGFGAGSAVAHRAVDSVMGPRQVEHVHSSSEPSPAMQSGQALTTVGGSDACSYQLKSFQDCIVANGSDIGKCQFYVDMLSECRRGSVQVTL